MAGKSKHVGRAVRRSSVFVQANGELVPTIGQSTKRTFNNAALCKVIFLVGGRNSIGRDSNSTFLGDQARNFFVKSSLPGDILRKIW